MLMSSEVRRILVGELECYFYKQFYVCFKINVFLEQLEQHLDITAVLFV